MSQVFGRRSVFLGIGVFRLLALPACCLLMTKTDNLLLLCLLAALFGSCGNAAYAPLLVFLNERFPTTMRASGVGFSWSVGFAIGGMAPTFTLLAAHTPAQLPITVTAFLVGSSILTSSAACSSPRHAAASTQSNGSSAHHGEQSDTPRRELMQEEGDSWLVTCGLARPVAWHRDVVMRSHFGTRQVPGGQIP